MLQKGPAPRDMRMVYPNQQALHKKKLTRYLGLSYIVAGACFLFEPYIGIIDLLPDCLGYLFLFLGLYRFAAESGAGGYRPLDRYAPGFWFRLPHRTARVHAPGAVFPGRTGLHSPHPYVEAFLRRNFVHGIALRCYRHVRPSEDRRKAGEL